MKIRDKLKALLAFIKQHGTPSPAAWQGATSALRWLSVAAILALILLQVGVDFTWQKLVAVSIAISALLLAGTLVLLPFKIIAKLPPAFRFTLFMFLPFLLIFVTPNHGAGGFAFLGALVLLATFTGAALAVFRRDGFRPATQKVTLACLLSAVVILGLS